VLVQSNHARRSSAHVTLRPPNVAQRHANQAMHARTFFLSDFVSIENKGSSILIPKLVIRVQETTRKRRN